MKICVVKAGSSIVTQSNGVLDLNSIQSLCSQVTSLHQEGWGVIIVSSGSVAAGKPPAKSFYEKSLGNAVYAAVGQSRLISYYDQFIRRSNSNLRVSQMLLTREYFSTRENYIQVRDNLFLMLEHNIVPIINENDALGLGIVKFLDNDHLASMIASMVSANLLIILSEVGAIYNKNPNLHKDNVVRFEEISFQGESLIEMIEIDDRNVSRGGMKSKLDCFRVMHRINRQCILLGKTDINDLTGVIENERKAGTRLNLSHGIVNSEREKSMKEKSMKEWLLMGAVPQGIIILSPDGAAVMSGQSGEDSKRSNLYTVGIIDYFGNFERRDVISVRDENFNLIGVGRIKYSRTDLDSGNCGKVFIHDDHFARIKNYLFVDLDSMSIRQRVEILGMSVRLSSDKKSYVFSPRGHRFDEDNLEEDLNVTVVSKDDVAISKYLRNWSLVSRNTTSLSRDQWILYAFFEGKKTINSVPLQLDLTATVTR